MIYIDDDSSGVSLNDEKSSSKFEEKESPIPGIGKKSDNSEKKQASKGNSIPAKPNGKANSKAISNEEVPSKLKDFWYLMGITIDNNFASIKRKLLNYGYDVKNKEQATKAISDLWISDDFIDFFEDISPEFEAVVVGKDSKILEEYQKSKEKKSTEMMNKSIDELSYSEDESPFVGALIAAIGTAVGATGSIISSSQQKKIEKERARAEMTKGILDLTKQEPPAKRTNWMMIITIILFIILIVVGVVLYKKYKR